MALSSLEQAAINASLAACKTCIEKLKPAVDELDSIYNSAGGCKTTITQANLDSAAYLGGLTKQQLDDGVFALTSTIKGNLTTAYAQLAQLAARGTVPLS